MCVGAFAEFRELSVEVCEGCVAVYVWFSFTEEVEVWTIDDEDRFGWHCGCAGICFCEEEGISWGEFVSVMFL